MGSGSNAADINEFNRCFILNTLLLTPTHLNSTIDTNNYSSDLQYEDDDNTVVMSICSYVLIMQLSILPISCTKKIQLL